MGILTAIVVIIGLLLLDNYRKKVTTRRNKDEETNFPKYQKPSSSFAIGMGLASIIIGVFAVMGGWVPFFGIFALPLSFLGGIIAIIGILAGIGSQSKGMPIAGLVICALPVIWQTWLLSPHQDSSVDLIEHHTTITHHPLPATQITPQHNLQRTEQKYIADHVFIQQLEGIRLRNGAAGVSLRVSNTGDLTLDRITFDVDFRDTNNHSIGHHTINAALSDAPLIGGQTRNLLTNDTYYIIKGVPYSWSEGNIMATVNHIHFSDSLNL